MVHLRLPSGQFGLVLGGHVGGDMVACPRTPLNEAEANQKRTETRGGGYPHGGRQFCKYIPVFQGNKVLPPPPRQSAPMATAAKLCSGPSKKTIQIQTFKMMILVDPLKFMAKMLYV